jgi:hypothetical protein
MISLKNGALIRPLNIETADILDVAASLENYDLISISFYCEAGTSRQFPRPGLGSHPQWQHTLFKKTTNLSISGPESSYVPKVPH